MYGLNLRSLRLVISSSAEGSSAEGSSAEGSSAEGSSAEGSSTEGFLDVRLLPCPQYAA